MYWLTSADVETGIDISEDNDKLSLQAFCIISRLSIVHSMSLQARQFSNVSLRYRFDQLDVLDHSGRNLANRVSLTKNFQILQSYRDINK